MSTPIIGQQVFARVDTAVTFTTNVTPATVGLIMPIGVGQQMKFRAWVPFTVGATGGIRSIVTTPAAPTLFTVTTILCNVAGAAVVTASANTVFTNAVANAGTSFIVIEGYIVNGTTAGNIDVQFAQNTSDALTLTILRGAFLEIVKA